MTATEAARLQVYAAAAAYDAGQERVTTKSAMANPRAVPLMTRPLRGNVRHPAPADGIADS